MRQLVLPNDLCISIVNPFISTVPEIEKQSDEYEKSDGIVSVAEEEESFGWKMIDFEESVSVSVSLLCIPSLRYTDPSVCV